MELVKGLVQYDKKSFADPYGNGVQRFDRLTTYVDMAIRGLGDNTASAIEVAKALFYIRKDELYKDYPIPGSDGVSVFQDFNTFCKEIFKCRKSTVYNYIALYETFGGDSVEASATPSNFNVSDYTYTQLLLMLPLSAPERLNIKPDWTCKQIKDYVKEHKSLNSNRLEKSADTAKNDYGEFFVKLMNLLCEQIRLTIRSTNWGDDIDIIDFTHGELCAYVNVLEKFLGVEYPLDDEYRAWYKKFFEFKDNQKSRQEPR